MEMTPEILKLALTGSLSLCAILFAGNMYFIRGLVNKIETGTSMQTDAQTKVKAIHTELSEVKRQVGEIKEEIKPLRKMESDVAVLKDRLDRHRKV